MRETFNWNSEDETKKIMMAIRIDRIDDDEDDDDDDDDDDDAAAAAAATAAATAPLRLLPAASCLAPTRKN